MERQAVMRRMLTALAVAAAISSVVRPGARTNASAPRAPAEPSAPPQAKAAGRAPVETLCGPGEKVLFNCRVGGTTKIVSLCGSAQLDAERGYLQYRFGRPGRLELEYPKGREGTQRQFRYSHYFRYQVDRSELSFENGGYGYSLFDFYEGDQKPVVRGQGVRVSPPGEGNPVELNCSGPVTSRLADLAEVVQQDEESP